MCEVKVFRKPLTDWQPGASLFIQGSQSKDRLMIIQGVPILWLIFFITYPGLQVQRQQKIQTERMNRSYSYDQPYKSSVKNRRNVSSKANTFITRQPAFRLAMLAV